MENLKRIFTRLTEYIKTFTKWIVVSALIGAIGGIVGVIFHYCIDYVTEFRMEHNYIIYFLPIGGLIITAMYRMFRRKGSMDTNTVIQSVSEDKNIPFVMVPLIFLGTAITHLFGGSAGREGAALQIGGGIGYNLSKAVKFDKKSIHLFTMAGMSSVFAALFGTPVTAAIFPLEMISVGVLNFTGFLPCIIAASTAYFISTLFGITPISFELMPINEISPQLVLKISILAVFCAILSIAFCLAIGKSEKYLDKLFPNNYIRAFAGGVIIVVLTILVGTYDYNGAGMDVIINAVLGNARWYDFILKIIFTAITIAVGFKGGEIIPSLFIGATFGCVMSHFLGIDAGLGAAVGMISVFCGVVNCPLASIFLSVEMFGTNAILLFGIACAVSYIMSGYSGIYKSQKIMYSKRTFEKLHKD